MNPSRLNRDNPDQPCRHEWRGADTVATVRRVGAGVSIRARGKRKSSPNPANPGNPVGAASDAGSVMPRSDRVRHLGAGKRREGQARDRLTGILSRPLRPIVAS